MLRGACSQKGTKEEVMALLQKKKELDAAKAEAAACVQMSIENWLLLTSP